MLTVMIMEHDTENIESVPAPLSFWFPSSTYALDWTVFPKCTLVRFETSTTVTMKRAVFLDVMQSDTHVQMCHSLWCKSRNVSYTLICVEMCHALWCKSTYVSQAYAASIIYPEGSIIPCNFSTHLSTKNHISDSKNLPFLKFWIITFVTCKIEVQSLWSVYRNTTICYTVHTSNTGK